MVHSSPNNAKSRVHQSQACFLHTTHLGILKEYKTNKQNTHKKQKTKPKKQNKPNKIHVQPWDPNDAFSHANLFSQRPSVNILKDTQMRCV